MVGRTLGSETGFSVINPITVEQPVNEDVQATLDVYPITYDYPHDSSGAPEDEAQLTDFLGQEYIIHRIVGNIFVANTSPYTSAQTGTSPLRTVENTIFAVAGFFVARAEDGDNTSTGADVPIGMSGNSITTPPFGVVDNYSPLHVDTIREPWMWRRAWVLGTPPVLNEAIITPVQPAATLHGFPKGACFPYANWMYNQVNAGVTVDIKSRRHVRQDERLWIALANIANGPFDLSGSGGPGQLTWYYDLRIFGQLVKARARGAF